MYCENIWNFTLYPHLSLLRKRNNNNNNVQISTTRSKLHDYAQLINRLIAKINYLKNLRVSSTSRKHN